MLVGNARCKPVKPVKPILCALLLQAMNALQGAAISGTHTKTEWMLTAQRQREEAAAAAALARSTAILRHMVRSPPPQACALVFCRFLVLLGSPGCCTSFILAPALACVRGSLHVARAACGRPAGAPAAGMRPHSLAACRLQFWPLRTPTRSHTCAPSF